MSLTQVNNVSRFAAILPVTIVEVDDTSIATVSCVELHAALGSQGDVWTWTGDWIAQYASFDDATAIQQIKDVLTLTTSDPRLPLGLAKWIARNARCQHFGSSAAKERRHAEAIADYLERHERRHRRATGGLLTAIEIAEEFFVIDRSLGCTVRIGNAITRFAALHPKLPSPGKIGPSDRRVRAFPSALVEAWVKHGGGAAMFDRERALAGRSPLIDHGVDLATVAPQGRA